MDLKRSQAALSNRRIREVSEIAREQFGALLTDHLNRGTRPKGQKVRPWSDDEFARAAGRNSGASTKNWRKGKNLPPRFGPIENALFGSVPGGDDEAYSKWRSELKNAYEAAQEEKKLELQLNQIQRFEPNSGRPGSIVTDAISSSTHSGGEAQNEREGAIGSDITPPTANSLLSSNVPNYAATLFMGREEDLSAIETALKRYEGRPAIVALHGLHGVGKTTLAAAYATLHYNDYKNIGWIRAQTQEVMQADLIGLGVRLGWINADEKSPGSLAIVADRLRHGGEGILLIYDNAFDLKVLKPFLPSAHKAHVIITSNAYSWREVAAPINVATWPKEIGAKYLMARSGDTAAQGAAESLSVALGGLPLAHAQAGAYCEHLNDPIAEYTKLFDATPVKMLDDIRHVEPEYGVTVAKTFNLALMRAAQLHPAADQIMRYAALLPPEPIPLLLFSRGRAKLGEPLSMLDDNGLQEVIATLRAP